MVIAWERPHQPAPQLWCPACVCVVMGRVEKLEQHHQNLFLFYFIFYFPFPLIAPPICLCVLPAAHVLHHLLLFCLSVCLFSFSRGGGFFARFILFTLQIFACQLSTHLKNRPSNSGGPHLSFLFFFFISFFFIWNTNGFENAVVCFLEQNWIFNELFIFFFGTFLIPWPFFQWKWGKQSPCATVSAADGRAIINSYLGFAYSPKTKGTIQRVNERKYCAAPASSRDCRATKTRPNNETDDWKNCWKTEFDSRNGLEIVEQFLGSTASTIIRRALCPHAWHCFAFFLITAAYLFPS